MASVSVMCTLTFFPEAVGLGVVKKRHFRAPLCPLASPRSRALGSLLTTPRRPPRHATPRLCVRAQSTLIPEPPSPHSLPFSTCCSHTMRPQERQL
eukprot:scaffold189956_cov35-Tisochrysis_lutea.AAC.1